jgi:DNA-binding response OmpR family regulator
MGWNASVLRPAAVLVVDGGRAWNIEVIETVRGVTAAPLVILGALSTDRALAALRRGVDAIVPPELPAEETLARVYAIIRRSTELLASSTRYLDSGKVRLDLWRSTLLLDCQPVHLTTTEFRLLALLMRHSGNALEPRRIVERVWQAHGAGGENALRIAIGRLRSKLDDDARTPTVIESVRGRGYRYLPPVVEVPDVERAATVHGEQIGYLDSVAVLTRQLVGRSTQEMATALVDHLVTSTFADAAAVHEVSGERLLLRAHMGLSQTWTEAARDVALTQAAATAHVVSAGTPVQISSAARTYRFTHAALRGEDPGTYLFLPIDISERVIATVGVVRHSREFDVACLAYLRTVLAVFAGLWSAPSSRDTAA